MQIRSQMRGKWFNKREMSNKKNTLIEFEFHAELIS